MTSHSTSLTLLEINERRIWSAMLKSLLICENKQGNQLPAVLFVIVWPRCLSDFLLHSDSQDNRNSLSGPQPFNRGQDYSN